MLIIKTPTMLQKQDFFSCCCYTGSQKQHPHFTESRLRNRLMLSFWEANPKYEKVDIFQKAKLNSVEVISVPQRNHEAIQTKT